MQEQTGAGNWAIYIGRQSGGRRIEAQQYKVGRPWSGWVGTNVVREVGLIFTYTGNKGDRIFFLSADILPNNGKFEIALPGEGFKEYDERNDYWFDLPDTGTFVYKVRGGRVFLIIAKRGGQVIKITHDIVKKISWYEPGRRHPMLFNIRNSDSDFLKMHVDP